VDIGWRVLLLSWVERLPERLLDVADKMVELFDANVPCAWEMLQRKVKSPVPVNQNWVVMNLLNMYLALLKTELPLDPDAKDVPQKEKEGKLETMFWLAFVWSFGCTVDAAGRQVMDQYIRQVQQGEMVKEKFDLLADDPESRPVAKTPFPENNTVYEYFPHSQTNKWEPWTKKIVGFDIPKDAQVHSIIVPTTDTVRSAFFLQTLVASEHHVLFSGLTGTGKTAVIQQELLKGFDREKNTMISFAFSAQTTSNQTQDIIDGKLDRRRKGTYGPPLGKRCLIFVDDLNMPAKEKYGAQPPIELLRQWMDTSGWYDRKTSEFRTLIDLNFLAAMGPPGAGRPYLTNRYQRHYNLIFITPFENESLLRIFTTVMQWFLGKFSGPVAGAAQSVVKATIELYQSISGGMLPTPSKPHYTFNLRDLSKVHQGICACTKKSLESADDLARCWAHESHRVFYDRLTVKQDQVWFSQQIEPLLKEHFKKDWKTLVKVEPLIWCDFIDSKATHYQQVQEPEKLVEILTGHLQDYNSMAKRGMDLVLFMAAAQHVSQIVRVLKTPLGNCLLVGIGGSGRKSLATLGVFVAEQESFSIEISKSYGMADWHEDIKRLLIRVGGQGKEVCFLLPDTQIANENFLEETSGLLNNGEVPNLFNAEDKAQILEMCTNNAAAAGRHGTAEVFAFFTEQCMKNLHVVIALSPIGEAFRRRVRMFPSLVNCTTTNWFHEWPDQALQSVANYFLGALEMPDDVKKGCVDVCVAMQKSVFELSEKFVKEVHRHYYVTPTSYLELINSFKGLLEFKREEVSTAKSRYDVGLDKIMSTESQVAGMQAELEELQPVLKKTALETDQLMKVIEGEKKQAAAKEELVSKDAAETEAIAQSAGAMKADCERDLAKAMPALNSAIEALNSLNKADIVEVKNFKTPPGGVVLVSKALCWVFQVAPKKVPAPDGKSKMDDYWEPAKKVIWGDTKLLDRLMHYDKDNIPESVMAKLKPLESDEAFEPEAIKKASVAACGICKWVRAMIIYDEVAKMVGPKREALAQAEGELATASAALAEKKAELKEVQDKVEKLVSDFEIAKKKKADLQNQVEVCSKRLVTAEKLINGLGGEKTRWSATAEVLGVQFENLTGDVLIASGIIAYLGTFLAKYRNESVGSWIDLMRANKLPASSTFLLRTVLGEEVVIRQWLIDKLPNDQVSIDNALILSKSRRWPLMIDPQLQANKWIRNSNAEKLRVLRLSTANYSRFFEVAISAGEPVLLENVGETMDPLLEPLLQRATFKAGSILMIRLGDSTVEYNKAFRLYITTKLPNPHYSPEICVQVTLLNFMVTPDGLQDQMLGILVAKEEPEVEKKRQMLIVESAQSKSQLKEIEDKILEQLSNSKGNILDDEELINTLANSKITSSRIEERVKEQEKTQELVQKTRDTYVPVSVRASAMFFVIADLAKVEPMYQYSLEWFVNIYLLAISTAEKPERNLGRRLQALQDQFVRLLYEKVCDSLFAKDKLMLSMLLTFKSMEVDKELDFEEKALLLLGGTTGADVRPRPQAPWLTDVSWARLSEAEDLGKGPWVGLTQMVADNLEGWRNVFDSDNPVAEPWPAGFKEGLTALQKTLILLAIRPDCTVNGIQEVISGKLGEHFLEPPAFNLEKVYNDSNCCMPLIFVLSPGADPMAELVRLALKVDMNDRKVAVSLGQGQGPKAEAAITEGKDRGQWVILQNCHLAVSFMPTLERLVEELDPDKVAPTFRLWLSSMPAPHFPVSVLQNGMKMTVEPPKGLKSNLLRAYLSFEDNEFEESCSQSGQKQRAFRKMLFGLCFFHALIQERCNYGPLGWNIPYQFSEPDRQICVSQLRMFIEENNAIPYTALRYTAAEANYGGRVTDSHDRNTINHILTDFYCEGILKDGYKFSESGIYYAPSFTDRQGYLEYIKSLPINQMPEAFGLHANANLSASIKEAMEILDTANSMQPKGGGSGEGGKTSDQILAESSAKYLGDLRVPFDTEYSQAMYPVDYNESMNTVLNQELLRFNKLLVRVRATLVDIGKAVQGLVVMGPELEEVATGILLNKQPDYWKKVSYPSLKPMSSYVADFCARLNFFTTWIENGVPVTFWLSGFYFTQSFLTGQLQNFARSQRLPIDTLVWTFQVLKKSKTEFEKPESGCFVYGLFMDGARWDDETGVIAESLPKVLFSEIPHMHWIPCEKMKDTVDKNRVYPSPVYKTSERKGVLSTTGHSTNFVSTLLLPMAPQHDTKFWTKRGVACLTQLDD
jgi:dynein heavy chain